MNQPKGPMSVYGYEKSSNKVNDKKQMNEIYKPYQKGVCVHTPATFFITQTVVGGVAGLSYLAASSGVKTFSNPEEETLCRVFVRNGW
jgi:hypothetical protein